MMFDEITASSLVRIDTDGNKLDDSPFPVNPAGFTIHSAVHAARHDAACVLHVHSLNGVAVSAQKEGVLPLSQQSIFILASLGYHDYEGVALNDEEKPRLVADLGDKRFLMLRNHGLLTVAKNIPDAFLQMYLFESACTIQVRAQSGGGELVRIPAQIIAGAQQQAREAPNRRAACWPGRRCCGGWNEKTRPTAVDLLPWRRRSTSPENPMPKNKRPVPRKSAAAPEEDAEVMAQALADLALEIVEREDGDAADLRLKEDEFARLVRNALRKKNDEVLYGAIERAKFTDVGAWQYLRAHVEEAGATMMIRRDGKPTEEINAFLVPLFVHSTGGLKLDETFQDVRRVRAAARQLPAGRPGKRGRHRGADQPRLRPGRKSTASATAS